jgi:hypothetical protein
MANPELERLKSWFADYASGFYTGDPEHDRVFRLADKLDILNIVIGHYIERLSASMPATADVTECVRMAREHLCRQAGRAV